MQNAVNSLSTQRKQVYHLSRVEGLSHDDKAAGTRLRNSLQKIKGLATDIHKEVTDLKNKVN